MDKSHIPVLAEVLELYYTHDELMERRGAYAALVARDVTDVVDEIAGGGILDEAS